MLCKTRVFARTSSNVSAACRRHVLETCDPFSFCQVRAMAAPRSVFDLTAEEFTEWIEGHDPLDALMPTAELPAAEMAPRPAEEVGLLDLDPAPAAPAPGRDSGGFPSR